MRWLCSPARYMLTAALMACTAVLADVTEQAELEKLHAIYEKELTRVRDYELEALADAQETYLHALQQLEKSTQSSGSLDAVVPLREERLRFDKLRGIETMDLSAANSVLRKLQEQYLRALREIPISQANRILTLAVQYDRSLDNLEQTLTREGGIDSALAVRTAREQLKLRTEVSSAREILARQEAPRTPTPPASPAPAPEPDTATARASTPAKYTGSAGNYVRKRFNKLLSSVEKQDWAAATEFVDPEFVEQQGSKAVENRLRLLFPLVRFADDPRRKLDAGDVSVNDDEVRATVVPRVWLNVDKKWHDLQSHDWVLVDGDWYIDIGGGAKLKPQAPLPLRKWRHR